MLAIQGPPDPLWTPDHISNGCRRKANAIEVCVAWCRCSQSRSTPATTGVPTKECLIGMKPQVRRIRSFATDNGPKRDGSWRPLRTASEYKRKGGSEAVDGQLEAIRWTARLLDLCACADVAAEGQRNRGINRPDACVP
jgi:hypothetical protein